MKTTAGQGIATDRLTVVRPPIPLHSVIALTLAFGVWVGYGAVLESGGGLWGRLIGWACVCIGIVAAAVLLGSVCRPRSLHGRRRCWICPKVAVERRARVVLATVTAALLLGAVLGGMQAAQWMRGRDELTQCSYGEFTLDITEGSTPTEFGQQRAVGTVVGGGLAGALELRHDEQLDVRFGQRVTVVGRVRPVTRPSGQELSRNIIGSLVVSGRGAAQAQVRWQSGLVGWLASLRGQISSGIESLDAPPEGRALLAGLMLGERAAVREVEIEDAFRTAGVSHILSVSGSHLAVVVAAVIALGRFAGLRRFSCVAVAIVFALAFTVLTGGDPATQRAWLMLVAASVSLIGGRRADGIVSVSWVAGILLVSAPQLVFSIGFWLSISAVMGLLLFTRYAADWVASLSSSQAELARNISIPLAATIAAQLSTLPISVTTFGAISLVAPLANAVIVPLSSLAIVVGLVGALFHGVSGIGTLPLAAAAVIAQWVTRAAQWFASVPGAEVTIGPGPARGAVGTATLLSLAAVYWRWRLPSPARRGTSRMSTSVHFRLTGGALQIAGALAVMVVLWFAPELGVGDRVVILNVGQGDATLIQSDGRTLLIDGGPDERRLKWELLMAGCLRVDEVVTTHDHEDHIEGLGALDGQMGGPPSALYCAAGAQVSEELRRIAAGYRATIRPVTAGTEVVVGSLSLTVLGPTQPVSDSSANESCLVVLVGKGQGQGARRAPASAGGAEANGILIGGDAESGATIEAVRHLWPGAVAVLKVGHHGSEGSLSQELLDAIRPRLAVISVGEGNRYGHPADVTIRSLRQADIPFHRTDLNGRVVVRF